MSNQPNILILSADAMRYDALGCNGSDIARTPHLDGFAAAGVNCERAYCSQPICMPCRASIMTGRYPSAHGVWQNGVALPESEVTLPAVLGHQGYDTELIGKAHFQPWLTGLEPNEAAHHREPGGAGYYGFDRAHIADHSDEDPYYEWVARHHPENLDLARNPRQEAPAGMKLAWKSRLPAEATKTHYLADLTIDALRGQDGDKPFLLWSSIIDPHHPYNPPAPYCDWYDDVTFAAPPHHAGPGPDLPRQYHDWVERLRTHWGHTDTAQREYQAIRRMYQGKVSHVDAEIGRILQAVRDQGLWDNTVIVFLSDHGTMLGDFGLLQVGEYSQEPLIHIPMFWHWPSATRAGGSTAGLVSTIDIMPTLLDAAGIESPLGVQGKSLRPQLTGEASAVRDQLLVENRWGQSPPDGFQTLITERHKLSLYTNQKEGELYDLATDPLEERNLFNRPVARAVQADLAQRFAVELLRQQNPLPARTGCW